MDENVPRSVATGLRLRGVDFLTVQEDGWGGASDPEVLSRATELGRVLISRDDDLLASLYLRKVNYCKSITTQKKCELITYTLICEPMNLQIRYTFSVSTLS